jgi:hypothetical protein
MSFEIQVNGYGFHVALGTQFSRLTLYRRYSQYVPVNWVGINNQTTIGRQSNVYGSLLILGKTIQIRKMRKS